MSPPRPLRALPFAYLVALSAVAGVLAVLGAALDRFPFVPAAVGGAYGSALVRLVTALTTPLDHWGRPAEAATRRGPDAPARPRRRHN